MSVEIKIKDPKIPLGELPSVLRWVFSSYPKGWGLDPKFSCSIQAPQFRVKGILRINGTYVGDGSLLIPYRPDIYYQRGWRDFGLDSTKFYGELHCTARYDSDTPGIGYVLELQRIMSDNNKMRAGFIINRGGLQPSLSAHRLAKYIEKTLLNWKIVPSGPL